MHVSGGMLVRSITPVVVALVAGLLSIPALAQPVHAASCAPLGIAHRGKIGSQPEHTLRAYRAALGAGMTTLEADVRFTQDRVPVLMHDGTVDRTTDGSGPVSSYTWRQLRRLDAGDGTRVARLVGLADLAERRGADLVLEIKPHDATHRQIDRFLRVIRARHLVGSTLVQSFDPDNLQRVRREAPGMSTGLLTREAVSNDEATEYGSFVLPRADVVTRKRVRRWHRADLAVFTWTVNRRNHWRALAEARVDAIITDRARAYRAWRARRC